MEELQLILDALDGTTDKAMWVAVLWLLQGYVVPITFTLILANFGKYAMGRFAVSAWEHGYRELLRAAGDEPSIYGPEKRSHNRVLDLIKRGKNV